MTAATLHEIGNKRISSNGENGNGSVTAYRIGEIERRLNNVDLKLGELSTTCTRIEAQLNTVVTDKEFFRWGLYILGGGLVTIIINVLLFLK